jgi:hypothetical protein
LLRNSLVKHIIEGNVKGKVEGKAKRGRRRKQLVLGFKENRRYWKLKV